jgi:hypothetical protein
MRKYLISYLSEQNDECVDCETTIEAGTVQGALQFFEYKIKVYKRVTKIEEIC